MATHARIFQLEEKFVEAREAVEQTMTSFGGELSYMMGHGPYPENRGPWETLAVNAEVLRNRLSTMLEMIRKHIP